MAEFPSENPVRTTMSQP